jgi:putative membrane protein
MKRSLLCLALAVAAGVAMPMVFAPSPSFAAASDATTYVQKAAVSDLFEIESSKLAATQASNPEVKSFAAMMITDHTQSSQKIAAAASGITLPTKLDKPHEEQLAELQKMSGTEFDRSYIEVQVKAHTDALKLHQDYADTGSDAKLKAVAAEIAPVVSHHLEQAKHLAGGS